MEISTIFYLNDDATGLARAMRATLATLGHYAVAEAETSDEALSLLRRELPGLSVVPAVWNHDNRLYFVTGTLFWID